MADVETIFVTRPTPCSPPVSSAFLRESQCQRHTADRSTALYRRAAHRSLSLDLLPGHGEPGRVEAHQHAVSIAAWAATVAAAALMYFEVRAAWVAIAWAALALLLIIVGCVLRRSLFVAQSLVLLLAAAIRAILFNLFSTPSLAPTTTSSRVFCIGVTCALMLAALPFAFRIRRQQAESHADNWLRFLLLRPEQPLFFVPLALLATLLAVQLRRA